MKWKVEFWVSSGRVMRLWEFPLRDRIRTPSLQLIRALWQRNNFLSNIALFLLPPPRRALRIVWGLGGLAADTPQSSGLSDGEGGEAESRRAQ